MKASSIELDQMLYTMEPLLDRKGLVGMVAAKNTRIIRDAIMEYTAIKMELIRKYGKDDGKGGISIDPTFESFEEFREELEPYAQATHSIEIMTVPLDHVMDDLTGNEMLALSWMLDGVDGNGDPS